MVDVPHLSLPLTLGPGGRLAVVEQDEIDDVAQCVTVLLRTPVGSRIEDPDYGISDLTFRTDLDLPQVADAVAKWEDRAVITLEHLPPEVTGEDVIATVVGSVSLA